MATAARFRRDLTDFVRKTGISLDLVLRKLALDGFRKVLLRSPVDTGRFRSSWRVAVNGLDDSVAEELPKDTASAAGVSQGSDPTPTEIARGNDILSARFGDTINITNNLPYAVPIEEGHSGQAPQGVLRLSFDELVAEFGAVVDKVRKGA